MNQTELTTRRSLFTTTLAAVTLTAGILGAQVSNYKTTRYGGKTGNPAAAAAALHFHLDQGENTAIVSVTGGVPGNPVALIIGVQKLNVPLLGSTLLVNPIFAPVITFDQSGHASFPLWPRTNLVGARFLMQIVESGPQALFVASEGMEVEIVAQPATPFSFTTAKLLTRFADVAYDPLTLRSLWPAIRPVYKQYSGLNSPPPGLGWRIVDTIDNATTSTQLFLARNDDGDLAIAFRGSKGLRDWVLTNANRSKLNSFHEGFYRAAKSVQQELLNDIDKELATICDRSERRIYFTGHSLGGALATVTSYHIAGFLNDRGYTKHNLINYTFGSPRTMAVSVMPTYTLRMPHHYAVASKDDIVTHVPKATNDYTHIENVIAVFPTKNEQRVVGSSYRNDDPHYGASLWVKAVHNDYTRRILIRLFSPTISITNQGGMARLNWSYILWGDTSTAVDNIDLRSKYDYVALYQGDPLLSGGRYLCGNPWQWAVRGSNYTTTWPHSNYFGIAYNQRYKLNGHARMLKSVRPAVNWAPRANYSRFGSWPVHFIRIHWANSRIGSRDYIALYKNDPRTAGATSFYIGTKTSAGGTTSGAKTTLHRWGAGDWVGYVRKDCLTSTPVVMHVVQIR